MLWLLSFLRKWIWPYNQKELSIDDFTLIGDPSPKVEDPVLLYLGFVLMMHNDRRNQRRITEK